MNDAMSDPIEPTLSPCGCCDDGLPEPGHTNPPGLAAIAYRIGAHPDFLARMTARLHAWEILTCADCEARFVGPDRLADLLDHIAKAHPAEPNPAALVVAERPLADLGTRAPDDPAIALLDAWAVAGDVLTFYQERFANEHYLRTATERRSILEMARAIGYELDPGVAAETYVAFTVDDADGAPTEADVPAGTQLMSIPAGGDERPQTFETDAELTAHVRWNAVRPRLLHPQVLTTTLSHVFLDGLTTGLERGDRLLLVLGGTPHVRQIRTVTPGTEASHTRVDFMTGSSAPEQTLAPLPGGVLDPNQAALPLTTDTVQSEIVAKMWDEEDLQAFLAQHGWDADVVLAYVDDHRVAALGGGDGEVVALRQRAAVFGHTALDWKTLPDEVKADYLGLATPDALTTADKLQWPDFVIFSPTDVNLVPEDVLTQITMEVTAQQVHDAVQGALGSATAAAFGAASSAGAAAAASAASVAQRAMDATVQAKNALEQIVADTSAEVGQQASDLIDAIQDPFAEVEGAITAARNEVEAKIETPSDLPSIGEIVAKILELGVQGEASAYLEEQFEEQFASLAGRVRDSYDLGAKLRAIADQTLTKAKTLAKEHVEGVGSLAQGIAETIVETAAPALEAMRTSAEAHTRATVGATGKAAQAAGASAAAALVGAAVRAALADSNATPESVADTARAFAEASVAVLQVHEGPLPTVAQQALDSGIGQQIAGTVAGAQQVVSAVQATSATADTLELVEGFVELAQGPRIGGEQVRAIVFDALDRIEAMTHDSFRLPLPTRRTDTIDLDRVYKKVLDDSWALLTRPGAAVPFWITTAQEAARAEYGLSGKTTRITLDDPTDALEDFRALVRETTVHAQSEALTLAPLPLTADLTAGTTELRLGTMVLGLAEGQVVALRGEEVGADGAMRNELLTLDAITHSHGTTVLTFEDGLARSYVRDTVTINANVVLASHGETVAGEVLGSGSGASIHQRFRLKKPPLTHRSAVGGSESALTVRVDGVAWEQQDTLYGLDGTARAYLVRIDDDANATVVFGDGKSGARLPTGAENVTATYRSGIGSGGEVGAGTITLLKTRPYGIRSVINPLAASGADDPETLADARTNAPLTVLTLDRIVSLQDYEDYARAYPGIGKARAAVVWNGSGEVVHLTVADADGDAVVEPLYGRLLASIEAARDPLRPVVLDTFQPYVFFVAATVLIDDASLWDVVKADVEAALKDAFSFGQRGFGQPVSAAEVLQVMHDIDGVEAVDLDELYKTAPDAAPSGSLFNSLLEAHPARYDKDTGTILPAELLLIHALGITLSQMNR